MKLNYVLPALCITALALSSAAAHADGLNLSSYVGGAPIYMTVEPYASGETTSGLSPNYYVGLTEVNFSLTDGGAVIGSIEAFCDDFNDEISVPDTYAVTVTAIDTPALEEAAYLGQMLGDVPSGNSTMDSDIQELIWNITAPSTKQFVMNSEMTSLYNQMMANYSTGNYTGDYYFNANGGGQSFMYTPTPAPEPPTLLTLATALIGLAFFARRRATVKA